MKPFSLFKLSAISTATIAQQSTPPRTQIYQFVEKMPVCPYDLMVYFSENLNYPDSAIDKGIEGRVVIQFVVEADGTIGSLSVFKGIGGGCDEEALRVIKNMPKWRPGYNSGKAVNTYFTQPLSFKLER